MIRLPDWVQRCADLPPAATESQTGPACFYGGDAQPYWLAYEVARDFLSAPRGFAILEIQPGEGDIPELNSSYEYDGIEYLEDGSMAERGWFRLQPSPWLGVAETQHLVLSLPGQRCELVCAQLMVKDILYHQPSAAAALRHWLVSHSSDRRFIE